MTTLIGTNKIRENMINTPNILNRFLGVALLAFSTAIVMPSCSDVTEPQSTSLTSSVTGEGTAINLSAELAVPQSRDVVRGLSWAIQGETGAFAGKFAVGQKVKMWTLLRGSDTSLPVVTQELEWTAVSESKLRLDQALFAFKDPTTGKPIKLPLDQGEWYVAGLLVGESGAAGQTFTFDPAQIRLNVTTPQQAGASLDLAKADYGTQTNFTKIPGIYFSGWSKLTITSTESTSIVAGTSVTTKSFTAKASSATLSPLGSVLRLGLNIATQVDATAITFGTEITSNPSYLEQAISKGTRAFTGSTITPKEAKIQGLKNGYYDLKSTPTFVATETIDMSIPLPEGEKSYLFPTEQFAASNTGVLYLWVAEGQSYNIYTRQVANVQTTQTTQTGESLETAILTDGQHVTYFLGIKENVRIITPERSGFRPYSDTGSYVISYEVPIYTATTGLNYTYEIVEWQDMENTFIYPSQIPKERMAIYNMDLLPWTPKKGVMFQLGDREYIKTRSITPTNGKSYYVPVTFSVDPPTPSVSSKFEETEVIPTIG